MRTADEEGVIIDRIVRSRRRTIGLEIGNDAKLVVRAPLRTPLYLIRHAVESRKAWIIRKQREMRAKHLLLIPKRFVSGEEFLFLGKRYGLELAQDALFPLIFSGSGFVCDFRLRDSAARLFEVWYRRQAEAIILPRIRHFAVMFGIPVRRLKISGACRRWGSCGAGGDLNFSWRLVMAPMEVIDYVVVHELAHIKEKNHSCRFWAYVESMMPDYRPQRRWLRDNGHILMI